MTGSVIESRHTGERLRWLTTADDTGGAYLELESWWPAGNRAAPHLHPGMEERWEVLEGRARIEVGGVVHEAGPGESVVAPAGAVHLAANAGMGVAHVRIRMTPALRWQELVERLFATEAAGLPALLAEYPDEIGLPR